MSKISVPATLLLAIALLSGCGQIKDRPDNTVVATPADTPTAGQAAKDAVDWNAIRQFFELYSNGEGLGRAALSSILEKYKDQFAKFLAGTKITPSELIDMLFKLDTNGDGRLTPGEVASGLDRVPILRWIPGDVPSISGDELAAALQSEYPNASAPARGILKTTLERYDEAWAGGNANGRLTRQELSSAGLILGMLGDTDFSMPVALPPGAPQDQQLVVEQLSRKIDAQLFGRYAPQTGYTQLRAADAQLEWSTLALRFHLIDRLADVFGTDGLVPIAKLDDALTAWGHQPQPHWQSLYTLYDQAFMGSAGKGSYGSTALFNLLTDLRFAERFSAHLGGTVSAASLKASAERPYLLATLLTLFPRTGQNMFMGDLADPQKDKWAIRAAYWDSIKNFDAKRLGGDDNGALDTAELTAAFAYARLIEDIYDTYDTNQDGRLSAKEARELFKALGSDDKRMVDAFFADIGLDSPTGDASFWEKLKLFFSGGLKTKPLTPYEFYQRLVKVLPRIMAGNRPNPGHGRSGD